MLKILCHESLQRGTDILQVKHFVVHIKNVKLTKVISGLKRKSSCLFDQYFQIEEQMK